VTLQRQRNVQSEVLSKDVVGVCDLQRAEEEEKREAWKARIRSAFRAKVR